MIEAQQLVPLPPLPGTSGPREQALLAESPTCTDAVLHPAPLQYLVVPEKDLIPVPDEVTDEAAAQFW